MHNLEKSSNSVQKQVHSKTEIVEIFVRFFFLKPVLVCSLSMQNEGFGCLVVPEQISFAAQYPLTPRTPQPYQQEGGHPLPQDVRMSPHIGSGPAWPPLQGQAHSLAAGPKALDPSTPTGQPRLGLPKPPEHHTQSGEQLPDPMFPDCNGWFDLFWKSKFISRINQLSSSKYKTKFQKYLAAMWIVNKNRIKKKLQFTQ